MLRIGTHSLNPIPNPNPMQEHTVTLGLQLGVLTCWPWETAARLQCRLLGGARRVGAHGGRRGAGAYRGSRLPTACFSFFYVFLQDSSYIRFFFLVTISNTVID